eukprot:m.198848 g.198848  ORF g.198848 m.198848 type:complete len:517 (-) comp21887_c0_seq1:1441-2991(-)
MVAGGGADVVVRPQGLALRLAQQRGVAQVVRHHDGGVQRGEIQRGNRHVVEAFLRVNHCGAFVLVLRALRVGHGNDEILLARLAHQLRHHLDLLSTRQQVAERHPCDTRHLHVVVHAHQFVQQTQRKIGVLHAVDGQSTAGLVVAVLEVSNDRVMHVLLLFVQKVRRHAVECVGAQFVVPLEHLQHVKLHAAVHCGDLAVACAVGLGGKRRRRDFGFGALQTPQVRERIHFQCGSTAHQKRKIKICNVVSRDNVGIHLLHKLGPLGQHAAFILRGNNLRAHNGSALLQSEHVAHKGSRFAQVLHHVCNLDHRVLLRLGKHTLAPSTLNVKTQNAKGRDFEPVAFRRIANESVVRHVSLNLTKRLFVSLFAQVVGPFRQFDPVATKHICIHHEPQCQLKIRLVHLPSHHPAAWQLNSTLQHALGLRNDPVLCHCDAKKGTRTCTLLTNIFCVIIFQGKGKDYSGKQTAVNNLVGNEFLCHFTHENRRCSLSSLAPRQVQAPECRWTCCLAFWTPPLR